MKIKLFILFLVLSNLAVASDSQNEPRLYAQNLTELLEDGYRLNARLSSPRKIQVSPDNNYLVIHDAEGSVLRTLDKNGIIKTTQINLLNEPKKNLTVFQEGGFLLANPYKNNILLVTDKFNGFLFAGQRDKTKLKTTNYWSYVTGKITANGVQELSKVIFENPNFIERLSSGAWIVRDGVFRNNLKYIDKRLNVYRLGGLEDLNRINDVIDMKVDRHDNVYLLTKNQVYKIKLNLHDKTGYIVTKWNNDKKEQFKNLTSLLVYDDKTLVLDTDLGALIELHSLNTVKVIFQHACFDHEKPLKKCSQPISLKNTLNERTMLNYIVKNPWGKGYIISDTLNDYLYLLSNGKVTIYAGKLSNLK